jgi:hypothetical protein
LAGSEGLLFLFLEEDSLEGEEEAEDCWLLWETSTSLSTRVRFLLRLVDIRNTFVQLRLKLRGKLRGRVVVSSPSFARAIKGGERYTKSSCRCGR